MVARCTFPRESGRKETRRKVPGLARDRSRALAQRMLLRDVSKRMGILQSHVKTTQGKHLVLENVKTPCDLGNDIQKRLIVKRNPNID